MKKQVAVLAGDGIGPEVMAATLKVAAQVAPDLTFEHGLIGGHAHDETGEHFPKSTQDLLDRSDAVLFGSVGGPSDAQHLPKWQGCEVNSILALRAHLNLNINMRPVYFDPSLADISPLKEAHYKRCTDFVILRELSGGCYFGEKKDYQKDQLRVSEDQAIYDEAQVESIARFAYQLAAKRSGSLTSVDKANVLATSALWRTVVDELASEYPEVTLTQQLVDNCAMQLLLKPEQYDVLVTDNLFGDILSDAASGLMGGLGLMPSASFNDQGFGLYEPAGGSAPDIAGQDRANPMAQMLSLALMLEHSFDDVQAAEKIRQAISATLASGHRTQDIAQGHWPVFTCSAFTEQVIDALDEEKRNQAMASIRSGY